MIEARTPSGSFAGYSLTVDGVDYPVVYLERGLFEIGNSALGGPGRVRYRGGILTDRIQITRPEGTIDIPFRLRRIVFEWKGRTYRVGTILGGHIRITDGPVLVVKGRVTFHGVQLEYVSGELQPFSLELALGFALKVAAMQPYPGLPLP